MDEIELIRQMGDIAGGAPEGSRLAARATLIAHIGAERSRRVRVKRGVSWHRILPVALVPTLVAVVAVILVPIMTGQQSAAARVLHAAARTAAGQPAEGLGPGEFAFTRSEGIYLNATSTGAHEWGALVRTVREIWVAQDGSGRIRQVSEPPVLPDAKARACWLAAGSPPLAQVAGESSYDRRYAPGGLAAPLDIDGFTPDQLLRLAGNQDGLSAAIRQQAERTSNPLGYEMLTIVGDLLSESVAPPRLRASLYDVAASIPGITLVGTTKDALGRTGLAVAASRNDSRLELIFDPATSALLARQVTAAGAPDCLAAGGIVESTVFLDSRVTSSDG